MVKQEGLGRKRRGFELCTVVAVCAACGSVGSALYHRRAQRRALGERPWTNCRVGAMNSPSCILLPISSAILLALCRARWKTACVRTQKFGPRAECALGKTPGGTCPDKWATRSDG